LKRREAAASKIQANFRARNVDKQRQDRLRQFESMISEGTILTSHIDNIHDSRHCLQMYMHVLFSPEENRCNNIKFSVFNYATKELKFSSYAPHIRYLHEFDPQTLLKIAKPSLKEIGFESAPF
jgi:hypothetical protein